MEQIAYTINDTAHLIGVSRATLYRMLKAGSIKAKKIRGRTIILKSDIDEYMSNLNNWHAVSGY